jgi:uncharacterized protein (DUF433 family)
MSSRLEVGDPFRTGKAYSSREAALLARTTPQTVRRWIAGYAAPGHKVDPVFGPETGSRSKQELSVSFLELIELVVASRFLEEDVSLDRIRRAHTFARDEFAAPFPFATKHFRSFGGQVIHRFEASEPEPYAGQMAFDLHGQWVLPHVVEHEIAALDFEPDDQLALRWYPFGRQAHVVIDPRYAGGRPVVEGTRIPVSAIRQRFEAGESIRSLTLDYGLETSVVESLLRLPAA